VERIDLLPIIQTNLRAAIALVDAAKIMAAHADLGNLPAELDSIGTHLEAIADDAPLSG